MNAKRAGEIARGLLWIGFGSALIAGSIGLAFSIDSARIERNRAKAAIVVSKNSFSIGDGVMKQIADYEKDGLKCWNNGSIVIRFNFKGDDVVSTELVCRKPGE